MSAHLHLMLAGDEMGDIERLARQEHAMVNEWIRRTLREARAAKVPKDVESKLRAIRRAAEFSFLTGDIETMLAELRMTLVTCLGAAARFFPLRLGIGATLPGRKSPMTKTA